MLKPDFIQQTKRLLHDEFESFEAALKTKPPTSIRINPRKYEFVHDVGNATNMDDGSSFDWQRSTALAHIPWCKTGYYLPKRPSFTYDPLFHAGAYYVQEASSMFIEQAIQTILADQNFSKTSLTTLDLCAAPGGKSTHLLTLLPDNSLLVSNEIIYNRSLILSENITKWGVVNSIITQNDPKDFGHLPHFFDVIVADLPCSGEGLFRKNPDAQNEWSAEKVKFCASRQRRIIHDVWNALKPGGYLIYSTCTFNTEENEDNVELLACELGAELVPIPIKPEWNISGALNNELPVYRFFPHRTCGEGFFLALFRKSGQLQYSSSQLSASKSPLPASYPVESSIKNMLLDNEKFIYRNIRPKTKASNKREVSYDALYAIPKIHANAFTNLSSCLHIIKACLMLGELRGNDFVPSPSLSLSTELNKHAFPSIALSREQAIIYLKRELIDLTTDTPKGYLLVTYRNIPLGFVKNTGHRANNLYPIEWRIRFSPT